MSLFEQLLLVLGLAMDGFAAAVCMGLSMKEHKGRRAFLAVTLVTGFHVLMFVLGHIFGEHCSRWLERLCIWLPGLLLTALGLNMLREAINKRRGGDTVPGAMGPRELWALAFGTSIDAMTVGLSFAMLRVSLWPAVLLVLAVMGVLAVIGVSFGRVIGIRMRFGAEMAGGLILCALGLKNLWGLW